MGTGALVLAGLALGAVWLAAWVAASVEHTAKPPADPFKFIADLVKGHFAWSPAATMCAIGEGTVLALVTGLVGAALWRWQGGRVYVDRRPAHGPGPAEPAPLRRP